MPATVYLLPTVLDENSLAPIPAYVLEAVKACTVFFVEDERTARRYLKKLWKEMVIDDYTWVAIGKAEASVLAQMRSHLKEEKTIGIMSEAGCPGVADPGQLLIALAQENNARVCPLTGPSSILLALMASGMNGQHFSFHGYLPIDAGERAKTLRALEVQSARDQSTHIFIETPYRNRQMLDTILAVCKPATKLCIAANITAPNESIRTQTITNWKKQIPELHKQPVVFLIQA
jgi:16S rRNA (cytidine1402-2'-O)-methyltransferase